MASELEQKLLDLINNHEFSKDNAENRIIKYRLIEHYNKAKDSDSKKGEAGLYFAFKNGYVKEGAYLWGMFCNATVMARDIRVCDDNFISSVDRLLPKK